jgi:MFS family permease
VRWKELVLEGAQMSKSALGVRGLLALLLSAFGIFGLWSGYAVVLLVDLSGALDLSPGPLSVALLIGTVASLAGMPALGWTADRLGRKVFLVAVTCVWGTGIAGFALAGDFWTLVLVLLFLSPSTGLYDVGINAAAVDLERLSRRRYMSFLHATYSGGALVGALVAGALLSAGVGYRLVYLSLLVPLGMLVLAFAVGRFPSPDGTSRDTTEGAGSDPEPELGEHSREGRWELYRSAPLLLIAAIAALGLMAEGLMETWSGIYLRDWLGLPALLGGSGVAGFFGAMMLGRLATGWVVRRLGNRQTLLAGGLLMAAGMALALATTLPTLAVAGFLVVGLAISGMAPLAQSVAGDLVPGRTGAAVSVVVTISYGWFLLAGPAVGGLAELVGLRLALGVIALAGLAVFVLSLSLRKTA